LAVFCASEGYFRLQKSPNCCLLDDLRIQILWKRLAGEMAGGRIRKLLLIDGGLFLLGIVTTRVILRLGGVLPGFFREAPLKKGFGDVRDMSWSELFCDTIPPGIERPDGIALREQVAGQALAAQEPFCGGR
jgi:hypothetical protein